MNIILAFSVILVLGGGIIAGAILAGQMEEKHVMGMSDDEMRGTFIVDRDTIVNRMLARGDYACCLTNPCSYCIEKTPGHGEGPACHCLDDVLNGRHPCGECIGEILEGHGNRFLAPYFATALAEEIGVSHLAVLKKIISEKYDIPLDKQI